MYVHLENPMAPSIQSLLFRQKGQCFFCQKELSVHRADVEHLFATSNGGTNDDGNCVAVCRGANRLMANLPLKEKIAIFRDRFVCPEEIGLSYVQETAPELVNRVHEKMKVYVGLLKSRKISRPSRRNSLLNQLSSYFKLAQGEAEGIITLLIESGTLHFDGAKTVWHL